MLDMAAADLLTEVETAITAILSGAQSYSLRGRSVTRANLAELREFRRELQEEIASDTAGGSMTTLGYQSRAR